MKTILVVDDEFDMTGTLRAILEGEGYRVETCADGREAIERLQASRPVLLLMDVMMPLMSGFEVLHVLRHSDGLADLPVVLMSSVVLGVKRQDYQWQVSLNKPFSLDALLKTVHELIGAA